jgi:hypothetical protein
MRPPERKSTDFEKVVCGDFVMGEIERVEYDESHKFKGFEGKEDKLAPAVRFVFKLEGYTYPHRSRWMNFNVGEKANLYKKYIAKLVNNAKPDMNFDLDLFTGMKIKTIWEMNGDFNNLESIYPNGPKLTITENEANEPPVPTDDDFVPEMEDADDVPL